MCGLVGVFGTVSYSHEKMFSDMLQFDVVRGEDSTGAAIMNHLQEKPTVVKATMLPTDLLSTPEYKKLTKSILRMMMGHNRAATKGRVNNKNAHPFIHGNITLAHNGTADVSEMEQPKKKFDTDSETICYSISKVGIKETWKKLSGAAVLIWWDQSDLTLNFISNGKRPFWFAYSTDNRTLLWASEDWMINVSAKRNNVNLKESDEEHKAVFWRPKVNMHFKFSYDVTKGLSHEVEELEPAPEKKYVGFSRSAYAYNWSGAFDNHNKSNNSRQNLLTFDQGKKNKNRHKNSNKVHLTKKDMDLATFRRDYTECVLCGVSLWDHYDDSVILHDHQAACPDCVRTADEANINLLHLSKGA